ncbi:MAG: polyprenol monophosphomannose synthase [Kineosporiaceae bacterium]
MSDAPSLLPRVLVIVPTYNERENLPVITAKIRAAAPEADILVADDNSPDGTGEFADSLAAADSQIRVLHRPGKQGLGAAYLAGFAWGMAEGYDILIEMDADGSHPADRLPALIAAVRDGADLAIGSRWVRGGEVVNWPKSREVLSRGGNFYTRLVLGIPIHDATAGFRAFRRTTLDKIDLAGVTSQGYCFQVDLGWRVVRAGLKVTEIPIVFAERELGTSKMSSAIVREALWRVTVWAAEYRTAQLRRLLRLKPKG